MLAVYTSMEKMQTENCVPSNYSSSAVLRFSRVALSIMLYKLLDILLCGSGFLAACDYFIRTDYNQDGIILSCYNAMESSTYVTSGHPCLLKQRKMLALKKRVQLAQN